MRIIDAHKVQLKLLEECQNIRHFDKDREKPQIFADGLDFAWVMLDNQPTVKAIPIEWIEEYRQNREDYADEYNAKAVLKRLLETWEKENAQR